jgi:lipopolysaccharide export system protein LptA
VRAAAQSGRRTAAAASCDAKRAVARCAFALALALALPSARGQPPPPGSIELEADSYEIDRKNNHQIFHNVEIRQDDVAIRADEAQGTSLEFADAEWVFTGNVQIESGGATLGAERATLNFASHRVRKATLDGSPVAFEQARAGATAPTQGRASRVEYDFEAQVLRLTGDAWLSEGQNEITGDSITYEIGAQRVIADADEPGDRVRITIVPPPETPPSAPEPKP